jgi:hypothetical protein
MVMNVLGYTDLSGFMTAPEDEDENYSHYSMARMSGGGRLPALPRISQTPLIIFFYYF